MSGPNWGGVAWGGETVVANHHAMPSWLCPQLLPLPAPTCPYLFLPAAPNCPQLPHIFPHSTRRWSLAGQQRPSGGHQHGNTGPHGHGHQLRWASS